LITGVAGAYWDFTYHDLNKVDMFFQPAHLVIYSSILADLIMGVILSIRTGFKSLMILSAFQLILGYSDLAWHNIFGFDTALSPPHIGLVLTNILNILLLLQRLSQIRLKIALVLGVGALWLSSTLFLLLFSNVSARTEETKYYVIPPMIVSFIVSSVLMPMLSISIAKLAHLVGTRSIYVAAIYTSVIAITVVIAHPYIRLTLPLLLAGNIVPSIVFDKNQKVGALLFGMLWPFTYDPFAFPIIAYAVIGNIFSIRETYMLIYSLAKYIPAVAVIGGISSLVTFYLTTKWPDYRRRSHTARIG
jgi:hypothetical protein